MVVCIYKESGKGCRDRVTHSSTTDSTPHHYRHHSHLTFTPSTPYPTFSTTMKIFVTGATGLVGSALIPKLVAVGHTVTGLARSPASLAKLESFGAKGVQGDISNVEVAANAAYSADVVIHLAFDHAKAFSGNFFEACADDRAIIKAICDSLVTSSSGKAGSKTFFIASGTLGVQGSNETDEPHRDPAFPRYQSTDLAFSYAPQLRVVQVRLAPITYGPERPHDFIGMQVSAAKEKGYVAFTEEGVWSTCDVKDSAECYALAVEKLGELPNPVTLHAIAEGRVALKEVAQTLAEKLGVETKLIKKEELGVELGFVGMLLGMSNSANSEWTRKTLGWTPKEKGLVEQLKKYSY